MTTRLKMFDAAPAAMRSFSAFSTAISDGGLDKTLLELVKIRASQINGCANCLNMHTAEARKRGESEPRLHLLAAWREAPVFTERERAALAWTECLTLVADRRAPDEVHAALDAVFTEQEQVHLTLMIVVINGWNRLAVGFGVYDAELGW